jgi:hypothetical protein
MTIFFLGREPVVKVSEYCNLKKRSNYLHKLSHSPRLYSWTLVLGLEKVTVVRFVLDLKAADGFWLSVSPTLFIGSQNRPEV